MRSEKTLAELTAWIDAYATPDAPDAQTLADFLGIELAPEPAPAAPVGQRRRSPGGVEVVKTDGVSALCWQRYAGVGKAWFSYDAIADWEVITDSPDCDREHLPDGHVRIDMRGYSSTSVREIAAGGAYMHGAPLAVAARAELARRGES